MKNNIKLTNENNKEIKVRKSFVEKIIEAFERLYSNCCADEGDAVYYYRGH